MRLRLGLLLVGVAVGALAAVGSPAPPAAASTAPLAAPDPFTQTTLANFLAGRQGSVTAALYNLHTGTLDLYRPGVTEITASMVKVDILETLLDEAQEQHRPLTAEEESVAELMIEQSDNDAANTLWNAVGAAPAVSAYNRQVGLGDTDPDNAAWGYTTTTAADQIRLLEQLTAPSKLLDAASQAHGLGLMEAVVPYQAWGISAGVPTGTTVALKNGWLPIQPTDWQVNSLGYVHNGGASYLLAVMTTGDPDEQYGIASIEDTARLVWSTVDLASGLPAAPPPPPTLAVTLNRASVTANGAVVHLALTTTNTTSCIVTSSPALPGLPRHLDCSGGSRRLALLVPPNRTPARRLFRLSVRAVGPRHSVSTLLRLREAAALPAP